MDPLFWCKMQIVVVEIISYDFGNMLGVFLSWIVQKQITQQL